MGKASPNGAAERYRDDPDAVSLHTTPDDYTYDDAPEISGLPPSYADSEANSTAAGAAPIRHVPPPTTRTDHNNPTFRNGKPVICETTTYMDSRYDSDPVFLEEAIRSCAQAAPVPLIYIMGTHKETVRKGDKKETRAITDFRIVINIQRYLRRNFDDRDLSSMELVTVENGEKAHRGTITKVRAPGAKQEIEVGTQKATLTEWCHRYCASPRMLRTFRLRRTITGFDEVQLKNRIEGVIRATNYRGHISVTFPIEDKNVDIYTSNRINEWRLKNWVCWIFYLTFLWIFTWPYLFFATKRYAIVRAEWPFSISDAHGNKTYTTVSEEQWFEKWHVAIRRLVLDRYEGEASEEMMNGVIARPADRSTPGSISTGHAGVDSAMGILTQGFQVARAIQGGGNLGRGGGWGYDC
ncbi:Nn.00g090630.m01.CDS01 [Neocucurbitaria sp. VM-36]